MHHIGLRRFIIGAAALAFVGTDSLAQTPQAGGSAPQTYGETISLSIKTTGDNPWHLEMAYDQPTNVMQEYTREGETGHNWSEMITVIALKKRPDVNTGQMILATIQRFRAQCASVEIVDAKQDMEVDELRQAAGLPATYQTYTAVVRCEDPKPSPNPNVLLKKHEVIWFKGMQGWLTSYLVQRAWHGDDIPPDSILGSDKTRDEWREWLGQVKVRGLPGDKRLDIPAPPSGN